MLDSRRCSAPQHVVRYLQMSTNPAPPPLLTAVLSLLLCQCVGMYRCYFLIVRGQARADNMLFPPSPHSQAHEFLWRAYAPILKPQVTPDPLALPPSGTYTWLNPILNRAAVTHSDKDIRTLTLIQPSPSFFLGALCGR